MIVVGDVTVDVAVTVTVLLVVLDVGVQANTGAMLTVNARAMSVRTRAYSARLFDLITHPSVLGFIRFLVR